MNRIERLVGWMGRALCAVALTGGGILSFVAIRDAAQLHERVTGNFGIWGWLLVAAILGGVCMQLIAWSLVLRGRAGNWSDARNACTLLVLTTIAYLALFPRSDGLSVELFLAAWAGAFATAVVLSSRRQRQKPSRFAFWLFQACLALLLLEGALRALSWLAPSPLLLPQAGPVVQRIETYSIRPGFVHFGFPHNSDGFYDDEFELREERDKPMVAVIGDSFSLSLVPHRAHYTTVCERELGDTSIYNIGVGACGPEEYRHLLIHDVLPLEPAAVVVSVFVGNDLGDLRLRSTERLRSWFERGNSRFVLVCERVLKIVRERNRGGIAWSQGSRPVRSTEAELIEAYPWYSDPRQDDGKWSPKAYMEMVRERIPIACDPDPARVRGVLDVLDSMRAFAKVPFGVMLIPAEFQIEDAVWNEALTELSGRFDRDEPQRSLRAGLEARGIPYLDLLPLCRAVEPMDTGNRHLYRLRDTHFGVPGNDLAGRTLAPFVRSLLR